MGATSEVLAQDAERAAERGGSATARAAAAVRPDECSSRHREEEVQAQQAVKNRGQRQAMARLDRRLAADDASGS
jgi:hypothetical protein